MPRARVLTDCPHSPCLLVQDCQTGHRTPLVRVRSKAHVKEEEEEEEESLFKADAVNEEDSERDRATQV